MATPIPEIFKTRDEKLSDQYQKLADQEQKASEYSDGEIKDPQQLSGLPFSSKNKLRDENTQTLNTIKKLQKDKPMFATSEYLKDREIKNQYKNYLKAQGKEEEANNVSAPIPYAGIGGDVAKLAVAGSMLYGAKKAYDLYKKKKERRLNSLSGIVSQAEDESNE